MRKGICNLPALLFAFLVEVATTVLEAVLVPINHIDPVENGLATVVVELAST